MDVISNLRFIGKAIDDDDKNPEVYRLRNLERVIASILNCMTEEQLNSVSHDFMLNNPKPFNGQ